MKAWITKYALTQGIIEVEADMCEESENMIRVKSAHPTFYHKNEWQPTKRDAIQEAEKMRSLKVLSLEKKIIKLKNMSFK